MKRFNIFPAIISLSFIFSLFSCKQPSEPLPENLQKLQQYDVVWDSPSKDYNGSMPLGNGDISLNAWVDTIGNLNFYIGKTDSWSGNGRLLKVGKVSVAFEPNIVFSGVDFRQELDLKSGTLKVHSKGKSGNKNVDVNLDLWIDANHPMVHVRQQSSAPLQMTANIEMWRTQPDSLPRLETSDLMEDRSKSGSLHVPVIVEPDSYIEDADNSIGWYHFNNKSVGFNTTNQLQGLGEYFTEDPLLHRIFGALITGTDANRINEKSLQTKPSKSGEIRVCVLTQHPSTPDDWQKAVKDTIEKVEQHSYTSIA